MITHAVMTLGLIILQCISKASLSGYFFFAKKITRIFRAPRPHTANMKCDERRREAY